MLRYAKTDITYLLIYRCMYMYVHIEGVGVWVMLRIKKINKGKRIILYVDSLDKQDCPIT